MGVDRASAFRIGRGSIGPLCRASLARKTRDQRARERERERERENYLGDRYIDSLSRGNDDLNLSTSLAGNGP